MRKWTSAAPASRIISLILREVVPRTTLSSTRMTRLPRIRARFTFSLRRTPRLRTCSLGSIKVPENAAGSKLPYRPETTAQVTARFRGANIHWLLLARYVGDRSDGFGTTLNEYTVMDGSFSYAITDDLSVSLRAENLTNKAYSDIVGYRSAGRTLYLGLNVSI